MGASHGLSPQSGVPQNNRIGDLDPYALDLVMRSEGLSFAEILEICASKGGLLGICGHNDMRDIEEGAAQGDERCTLAIEVLTSAVRDYLGAYVVELGGLDVISFTGGIGEHSSIVRQQIPVTDWSYVSERIIEIDAATFDPDAIYSLTYTALRPAYPRPAQFVLEHRSGSTNDATPGTGVLAAAWREVEIDDVVESQTHRYHQVRITLTGITDTRDVRVKSIGLRGIHLFGANPYAPGIIT